MSRYFRKALRLPALTAVIALAAVGPLPGPAEATPPAGVTTTEISNGELPAPVQVALEDERTGHAPGIQARRIVVAEIQIQPGGDTGWHRHGGPVWAVITSGTLHLYSGEDPECRAEVFPPGSVFLDPGDHTHLARNQGDEVVIVHGTFMLPEEGELRIDQDDPGHCAF